MTQVGLALLVERSRDADDDRVHIGDLRVIHRRGELLRPRQLHFTGRHAVNVRLPSGELFDFLGVYIEARHRKTRLGKEQGERQPNIAESDNPHVGRPV